MRHGVCLKAGRSLSGKEMRKLRDKKLKRLLSRMSNKEVIGLFLNNDEKRYQEQWGCASLNLKRGAKPFNKQK